MEEELPQGIKERFFALPFSLCGLRLLVLTLMIAPLANVPAAAAATWAAACRTA
ncbi:hypothetical protein [Verrucomicrobium sp. 3C]|uniref:hypothetical protein n=1 Tax=Verrucomicrobium sp. 3C TaxID=1134055 RepID=UPI0003A6D1E7|nr:hypothetical protein [Verrucomicrobium sp. 3C]